MPEKIGVIDVKRLVFTGHAARQMFARDISPADVKAVFAAGTTIDEYPDDRPFPSRLLLGFVKRRPIHVVLAYDEGSQIGYVVTVYVPNPTLWTDDFTARKTS